MANKQKPLFETKEMDIIHYPDSETTLVIKPKGRNLLDESEAQKFKADVKKILTDSKKPGVKRKVIVDFSDVDHLSSEYLKTLMIMQQTLAALNDEKLTVAGVNPKIWEVFKIAKLDKLFNSADTVQRAATQQPADVIART